METVWRKAPLARSKIRMRSSAVTTAYQPSPWVKAVARLPSGRATLSGIRGSPRIACGIRVTITATTTMTPTIIVRVSRITSALRNLSEGGSASVAGALSMQNPSPDDGDILAVTIGPAPPDRLDKALARDVPEEAALSRSRLARLIAEGAVARDGVVVTDAKARVAEGEVWEIALGPAEPVETLPEDIPLNVVWEDADLIVIDKPVGLVVHPAPGSWSGTLVNALLHHFGGELSGVGGERRPGIVHRIDKDTSGLLVVAKSDRAHHGLAAQFEAHSVNRRYLAVCHGVPDAADPRLRGIRGVSFEPGGVLRIATSLARHRTDRQRQAVLFEGGRHAVTRARVVEVFGHPPVAALVECWLETGRTHQIRVHLAYAGHGLIGDQTYGGARRLAAKAVGAEAAEAAQRFPRQALHAAELGFTHPVTGEDLAFVSPLPPDMEALVETLRAGQG